MRRIAAILALGLALAVTGLAVAGRGADSADTTRVDAIFDTAKGIVPGQTVKIAGARVGTVQEVRLTGDYKARMVLSVPTRFSFRRDASCTIRPEGLISENFVQCDPGTPAEPRLQRQDGVATVPVERTSVPVSINDLFRIFQTDVRQRFTVAIAAFGGGLAARGDDLNQVIRRSNPTLQAVNELLGELDGQRDQIAAAVRDTDAVLADLTPRREDVNDFITQSRRVTERTARRRGALAEGVRRLPALLDATDTSLDALDDLTTRGRPLLADLRAASPGLRRTLTAIGPFADAATPALRDLGGVAQRARASVRRASPLVADLRSFSALAVPVGATLSVLLRNLRDTGFVEALNDFAYYGAATSARYDNTSHLFATNLIINQCSFFATAPRPGCNSFYRDPQARTARTRDRRDDDAGDRDAAPTPREDATPIPTTSPTAPDPGPGATPAPTAAPTAPPATEGLKPLLDGLLKPSPTSTPGATPTATPDVLGDLGDFLLGGGS